MPPVMQEDVAEIRYGRAGVKTDDSYKNDLMRDFDEDRQEEKDQAESLVQIFQDFIIVFKQEDNLGNQTFPYREQLRSNMHSGKYFLEVDFDDLRVFHAPTYEKLRTQPMMCLTKFEQAAMKAADHLALYASAEKNMSREIQIQLFWSNAAQTNLRSVQKGSNNISILVAVPGMVVKCSSTKQRLVQARIMCKDCKTQHTTQVTSGSFHVDLPNKCTQNNDGQTGEKCRGNPHVILADKSIFVDTQFIKLQEMHESVPTGELPRHMQLSLDRHLVEKVSPGQRVLVAAINSIYNDAVKEKGRKAAGIRRRYLKGIGLMTLEDDQSGKERVRSINNQFSKLRQTGTLRWDVRQERRFKELSASPTLYEDFAQSLAPSISGHEDIKKAIICQLFGGSRKLLKDGGKLRGDMNVLLIGDPSTGKSQMLKFAHEVAPIGVYTSGKGSSAAGLTAAVVREGGPTGSFYLEGGSMVLADGGMVCIDEFDKMREQDTTAIHEAMEQQTISVAKAGLQCVLNSRTSVLAAANPIDGCYDSMKSNEEQMNFKATVLSRFDLIFKVLDPADAEKDARIARHIFALHKAGSSTQRAKDVKIHGKISPAELKSYIAWCRAQCLPQLSADAEERIKNFYVQSRKDAFEAQKNMETAQRGSIQLTVRQLESLVRITESLAKMRFKKYATGSDADEAIRLLKVATVDAIKSGIQENVLGEAQEDEIDKIQEKIEQTVPLGATVKTSRVMSVLTALNYNANMIERTLFIMCRRGEIVYKSQKKYLELRTRVSRAGPY